MICVVAVELALAEEMSLSVICDAVVNTAFVEEVSV